MFSLVSVLALLLCAVNGQLFEPTAARCTAAMVYNRAQFCTNVTVNPDANITGFTTVCQALVDCITPLCSTFNEVYLNTTYTDFAALISNIPNGGTTPPAYGCDYDISTGITAVGGCICTSNTANITGFQLSLPMEYSSYCSSYEQTCSAGTYTFTAQYSTVTTSLWFVSDNATNITTTDFNDTQAYNWVLDAMQSNGLGVLDTQFTMTDIVRNTTLGSNASLTATLALIVQAGYTPDFSTALGDAIAYAFGGGSVTFGAAATTNTTGATGTSGDGSTDGGAAEFSVVASLACVIASMAFFL